MGECGVSVVRRMSYFCDQNKPETLKVPWPSNTIPNLENQIKQIEKDINKGDISTGKVNRMKWEIYNLEIMIENVKKTAL